MIFLPSGLAYTGALCSTSQQSIVEDSFHATTATVAAHELGHRYGPSLESEMSHIMKITRAQSEG